MKSKLYIVLFFASFLIFTQCKRASDYEYPTDKNEVSNIDLSNLSFKTTRNSILSNIPIYRLENDSYNFIWCATKYGLYKYDGFKNTKKADKINSKIYTLLVENDTSIWLGTHNSGLIYFNPVTEETKTFYILSLIHI